MLLKTGPESGKHEDVLVYAANLLTDRKDLFAHGTINSGCAWTAYEILNRTRDMHGHHKKQTTTNCNSVCAPTFGRRQDKAR